MHLYCTNRNVYVAMGQFHIGEHLMAKNNLQNSLKLLVLNV